MTSKGRKKYYLVLIHSVIYFFPVVKSFRGCYNGQLWLLNSRRKHSWPTSPGRIREGVGRV